MKNIVCEDKNYDHRLYIPFVSLVVFVKHACTREAGDISVLHKLAS